MKPVLWSLLVAIAFLPSTAAAQTAAAAPSSESTLASGTFNAEARQIQDIVKRYITASTDKMAEADYSFRPTPEVRTFGQLIGHIANAQYMFCSATKGEPNPSKEDFEKKTAKADLVKALADSNTYCDAVYSGLTEADSSTKVKLGFLPDMTKLSVLHFNTAHNFEHYGNMVTYMRMKKLIPPSSERTMSGQ